MSKLAFGVMEVEGFKSITRRIRFDFGANGPGLHFVRGENLVDPQMGPNGVGKSSLSDALCWCLYGRTPSGLRNPDIKPWYGNDPTSVLVEVFIDDKKHKIIRYTKPNEIRLDGEPVAQEQIDALIGMPCEVFCHSILFAQAQPLFFDLEPRKKMEVFTEVLNLTRWEGYSKEASSRTREYELDLENLTGKIVANETVLIREGEAITALDNMTKRWEDGREERLATQRKEQKTRTEALEKAENELGGHNLKWDSAGTEAKALQREVEKNRDFVADIGRSIDAVKIATSMKNIEAKRLEKELDGLGKKSDECPTCGQSLKGTKLKKHKEELQDKIDAIDKWIDENPVKPHEDKLVVMQRLLGRAHTALSQFQAKEAEAKDQQLRWQARVSDLKAQLKMADERLEEYTNETNPHIQQLRDQKKKVQVLGDEIDKLKEDKQITGRRAERTKYWIKGFKDIRLDIIDEVMHELEVTTNEMLPEVGLEGWVVQYDIEKETASGSITRGLNVSILGPDNKKAAKWENWSGGEGQRLRIIGALALSQVLLNHAGVECDLEILDEPTQHMSTEGVGDLVSLLADRAKRLDRYTFLIDHVAVDSNAFSSVTGVVKTKSGTIIKTA